jgi:transcription initiation factor TFIIIB Brf1 subunit/transcription initiation factor TFIIB
MRMVSYCPECGGELTYDPAVKQYVCKSCGIMFTSQQLMEERDKIWARKESGPDQRKKRQKEYLQWWLSKKG